MRKKIFPTLFSHTEPAQTLGAHQQMEFSGTVRLLVWNILKAKRKQWQADFEELVADRDLVLFQEAVVNAPSDPLFNENNRFEWIMARSHQHPTTGIVTGVKTGSVAPSLQTTVHRSTHSEPIVNTQKMLLETHYPLKGRTDTLMVLNMHAINFVGVKKYQSQLMQLDAVLNAHHGPVILAGDFNTWSPQRMANFEQVNSAAGLQEATMNRRSKFSQLNQHLDHVYFRGLDLHAIDSLSHYRSSDHYPITATFHIEDTV